MECTENKSMFLPMKLAGFFFAVAAAVAFKFRAHKFV